MDGKTLARIGAVAFVGVAATVAAVEMNDRDVQSPPPATFEPAPTVADPLHHLLVRCQRLGAAATRDPICLKAWADNRRHFLDPDAPVDPDLSAFSDGADDSIRKETMQIIVPQDRGR